MANVGGEDVPALETHQLSKAYDSRIVALDRLDMTVGPGTITALVGPNGAGKSTLIKTWVGFEKPSAGQVAIHGIDPWRSRARALAQLGFVPQTPSLFRELTVAEHVDMAATLRPTFDRVVARARLADLGIPLAHQAGRLSGGQRAQLSLAIALGTQAPVLLLDEPLASLDPLARREFLQVLTRSVRASGATVLLSSHVITDLDESCDHVIVLGEGRKLLDTPIVQAKAEHWLISGDSVGGAELVGSFVGGDGRRMNLVRGEPDPIGPRPREASLDEIVLGYLASARSAERAPN